MSYYYNLDTLDLSRARVRCNGRALDKCSLASLIHEVALRAGNTSWPLWSDIYWYYGLYSELKEDLVLWLVKCNIATKGGEK